MDAKRDKLVEVLDALERESRRNGGPVPTAEWHRTVAIEMGKWRAERDGIRAPPGIGAPVG